MPLSTTRLLADLGILKRTFDLSHEVICDRWDGNPYGRVSHHRMV